MRSDQVISVNMRFLLKISEAEIMWWRHHDFSDSWLLMYDQSYEVSSRSDDKWSSYKWKHAIFVRNQWTVKDLITPSWRQGFMDMFFLSGQIDTFFSKEHNFLDFQGYYLCHVWINSQHPHLSHIFAQGSSSTRSWDNNVLVLGQVWMKSNPMCQDEMYHPTFTPCSHRKFLTFFIRYYRRAIQLSISRKKTAIGSKMDEL